MGRFAISDAVTALRIGRATGLLGGPFYGALPPKYITGASYLPIGYGTSNTAFNTTINRCYYFPVIVWATRTFAGAQVYNGGAGDNGETLRLMMFNDDASAGGPGTLAKDFGEITLTAAAALRTLTSSWAASAGLYWGAVWHNTAASMYGMFPYTQATAANTMGPATGTLIGDIGVLSAAQTGATTVGHYVDTAYGAAPATAVAPTTSLNIVLGGTTPNIPIFWLKA